MKANYLGRVTCAEQKARTRETRRQIAESVEELIRYNAATVLCWMHDEHHHGKVRLERDAESLKAYLAELKDFYELEDTGELRYTCLERLKAIGFDVSKLDGIIPIDYSITDVDEPLPDRGGQNGQR